MLTPVIILKKIEENAENIKKYGVEKIGLFGSYVKNRQSAESDIDLMVEFERGKKTYDSYMDLKFFLERLLKYKVDLVIAEAIKPDLKSYILKEVEYSRV